jgi:hypothetical protein
VSLLRRSIAVALVALAAAAPAASAQGTAGELRAQVDALVDTTATQWSALQRVDDVFQNPYPWDVAAGHPSYAPPLLTYALHQSGVRTGNPALVAAAERAWPRSVDPQRASAFDMLGAAYAYAELPLSGERRAQLGLYLASYPIPINGRRCLLRRKCWSNLKLVDALAILAITRLGTISSVTGPRLANPAAARAAAIAVVNKRVPQVSHRSLSARLRETHRLGAVISDPPRDPLAYHALSAFMLHEAVALLGPEASRAARRASADAIEALSTLMAPDGDVAYLGRGQGQVWVPALAAAALGGAARDNFATRPGLASRYLAGAQRAVERLGRLHTGAAGLQLVPNAATRTTHDGIDGYASDVAYNGLALFGLIRTADALAAIPTAAVGTIPADRRLSAVDNGAGGGIGILGSGRVWLAVQRTSRDTRDVRLDAGALALKVRTAAGWTDLLAPRPLTFIAAGSSGPSLLRRGKALRPVGFGMEVGRRSADISGGYYVKRRLHARIGLRWRLTRDGARLTVTGAPPGRRYRMLAFTPEGTGTAARRSLEANGARWRFSARIRVRRIPGYHSGPVERLDALEAVLRAPRSGRFAVRIGG